MIIVRSPLRITFGGGGTDLPSYYRNHDGFLVAAAIDRYIYVTIHQTFVEDFIVKYSEMERVSCADEVKHPIIRECFKLMEVTGSHLEVSSMADIPAGTGLGSSGTFCVALLRALHQLRRQPASVERLARLACEVEIHRLNEPVGKQDQYISAYGGITCFTFNRDDTVDAVPLKCREEVLHNLEDNLMLFFTGFSRSASEILRDQDERSKKNDQDVIANLHYVKELGLRSRAAMESGNLREFGELMDEHWKFKRSRSPDMSNETVDQWYEIAKQNGAIGGKLVGAGGGGFLMFYTEDRMRLRHAMTELNLKEVHFGFDYEGAKTILS